MKTKTITILSVLLCTGIASAQISLNITSGSTVTVSGIDETGAAGTMNGTLEVKNNGSLVVPSGNIFLRNNGLLDITAGGTFTFNGAGGTEIGMYDNSMIRISGTGSKMELLSSQYGIYMGDTSAVEVLNGGFLNINNIFVAGYAGAPRLIVAGTGSRLNSSIVVQVGGATATADVVVEVRDGGLMNAYDLRLDNRAKMSVLSGGTVNIDRYFHIGNTAGQHGEMVVDGIGSELTLSATNGIEFIVGVHGSGHLMVRNGGTINYEGKVIDLGWVAGSSGTVEIGGGGTHGTVNAAKINGRMATATVVFSQTDSFTFDPQLSGTLTVIQNGPGATRLTGSNTSVTATTNINNGALVYSNTSAVGANNQIFTGSGGYIGMSIDSDFAGDRGKSDLGILFSLYNQGITDGTWKGVVAEGTVWKNVTLSANAGIAVDVAAGETFDYNTPEESAVAFMKLGDGKMVLTMGENFSNGITVAGGILELKDSVQARKISILNNATLDVSTLGGFVIASGTTLGGHGKVMGHTTIKGTLAPEGGTLTFESGLTIESGAILKFTSGDLIEVTDGTLTLENGVIVNITGGAAPGTFFALFEVGTDVWEGDWETLNWTVTGIGVKGVDWYFAEDGSQLGIQVIPEPGTWAMILAGLGTLTGIQRMRRR